MTGILSVLATVVFFVNMKTFDGQYTIGRYIDARPAPIGAVARPHGCHLAWPSVVRVRGLYYLYAGEYDCKGWHRIVLFTSSDGVEFTRRAAVVVRPRENMRLPEVVYDGGVFHLWYVQDAGSFASELVYSSSRDGVHFSRPRTKLTAGRFGAINASQAFRLPSGQWRLLIETYNQSLTEAHPWLVSFARPDQRSYHVIGRMTLTSAPTPKIEPSFVCRRRGGGWLALFTAYGARGKRFAWEWTVAYRASRLQGPWSLVAEGPVLSLQNGRRMTSVENPTPVRSSAAAVAC